MLNFLINVVMSFDVIEGATAPRVALLGGQPSATYEKK